MKSREMVVVASLSVPFLFVKMDNEGVFEVLGDFPVLPDDFEQLIKFDH